MKEFDELLAAALVGTSRARLPEPAASALGEALKAVQGDAETVLLSRSALAGLVRFAGRSAEVATADPPAPAPAEVLPEAPALAARHLPLVLETSLLGEWLTLCAGAGWRVPPAALPALLNLARYDTALREKLRPVLGERGGWLAQFNPEWRFTPVAYSEEAWEEATEAQKEALFRHLWASDQGAARDWLQTQFKSERAGVRGRLLEVLRYQIEPEETELEPFFEQCLSDRSSEVQEAARRILQKLPASAYNTRMAARAGSEIALLLGKTKEGRPADPDWKKDGLEKDLSHKAALLHLFRYTHPASLLTGLGRTPEQLAELAKHLDALSELGHATVAAGHKALAQALVLRGKPQLPLARLAAGKSIEEEHWDALRGRDLETLSVLINELPAPWPADLTTAILSWLRDDLKGVTHAYAWAPRWRNNIYPKALVAAHPDAILPEALPDDAPEFARQTWAELLATLEGRQQMHRDFREARA